MITTNQNVGVALTVSTNAKTVAETELFTVPAGYTLHITDLLWLTDAISGSGAAHSAGLIDDEGTVLIAAAAVTSDTVDNVDRRRQYVTVLEGRTVNYNLTVASTFTTQSGRAMIVGHLTEDAT